MATLTVSAAEEKRVKAEGFLSNKGTDNFNGRVITVNGKITADQMMAICEASKLYGDGTVAFTTRLAVEVPGIPFEKIPDFQAHVAKVGLMTGGTGKQVRPVVSCKGTTCQYGLYDTFGLSEKIHKAFFLGYRGVKLPHKFKIATGGCPNNCVKPNLNDVGVVGQLIPNVNVDGCRGCKKCAVELKCPMGAAKLVDGKITRDPSLCTNCGRCVKNCYFTGIDGGKPGYKVYIGGRWGKKISHGIPLSRLFETEEEVLDIIESTILLFREQGQPGERLAQTVERIGFENVEKQLLSGELLARKEQILAEANSAQ